MIMKKLMVTLIIAAFVLVAAAVVSGCATSGDQVDTGILTGKVTVGPLTPVEQVSVTPPVPDPAVFTSRKLLLYEADGTTLVQEIPLQAAGYYGVYRVTLKPGSYVLDYPHQGVGGAKGLPAPVEIRAGKTTTLDVDIDTGIR
jgi:hypothetical protein